MTRRSITSCCIGSLLAIAAQAEPLPYRASMDVQDVVATGALWRVRGTVADSSVAAFDGTSVRTNYLLCCESTLGDVDLYRITAINTQTVSWLDCLVAYNGTGATARVGAPTFGQALVCYAAGTNGIPLTQYAGPSGPSMYLKDGLAAVALARLAARIGIGGAGATIEAYSGTVTRVVINGVTNSPGADGEVDLGTIQGGSSTDCWTEATFVASKTGSNLFSRADGMKFYMVPTNNTKISFDLSTYPTNGVSAISIAIKLSNKTLTLDTAMITGGTSLTLTNTNNFQELYFRKPFGESKFLVRQ